MPNSSDLSSRLDSSYAVLAPDLRAVPEGLDFTDVIHIHVKGDLLAALREGLKGKRLDPDVLVVGGLRLPGITN
jgi:hypothetical protein